jgi:hypothetical protein
MIIKQHLIIAPLNEMGQIMALNPSEFTDLGPCTVEEFSARTLTTNKALEVATQMNTLHMENAMRTKLILDGLVYSGIITSDGKLDASKFFKPIFTKLIKEHEMNQTYWAKWKQKRANQLSLFWGSLKVLGTGFLSKYGTKAAMFFKNKSRN